MSKEISNFSALNYSNVYGRVAAHDLLLNQGVLEGSSPTFANLTLTGDATVNGNLYVYGNTSILNTSLVEFKDNIILLNDLETGAGISLNQAGLEFDRGTLENYRIVWNEQHQRTEVGIISNLQPIAIRESNPLPYGIMSWNPNTFRVESTNTINIPFVFTSTQNSTSSSTGSLVIDGGAGINNDLYMNGKIHLVGSNLNNNSTIYTDLSTNTLNFTSPQNINITPSQKIVIPYNIPLTFGNNNISIYSNNVTNALNITSNGPINLTCPIGQNVNIPNQTAITFSTQNEKIYSDVNNNIVITSSKDVIISPNNGNGLGNKVLIPVNTPLAFGNINQNISSNFNNDLIIYANNNILLNPGPNLDVKIPTNNGIVFGGGGYQRITANTNNDLNVFASGDIYLTPNDGQHINIPNNIPLTFSNYFQSIKGDTYGNLLFFASKETLFIPPIYASNNLNSTSATNGSIHTNGGIGVAQSIVCESNIIINSQNSNSFEIKNNIGDLLTVNSNNIGKVNIYTGDGTSINPSLEISDTSFLNAQSLIQIKAAYDNTLGYMIGRGTVTGNSGRLLTVNIPSYSDYLNSGARPRFSITTNNTLKELFSVEADTGNILSLGSFGLSNTLDSTSPSTGSLVVQGGLGVVKSIFTSGKVIISVDSTSAFVVNDSHLNPYFSIDTIANRVNINKGTTLSILNDNFLITDTNRDVFNISTNSYSLKSLLQFMITNTLNSTNTSTGCLILSGGTAIQKNLNVGGMSAFHDIINMSNNNIVNLLDPIGPQDAATKAYVDLVKQGLFVKDSVMCATIQPQNLLSDFTPGISIDNYILILGDRILLLYQSNAIENGIYQVTNGTPIRPLDFKSGTEVSGDFVFVKQGTINSSLGFICNTQAPNDIVDTNSLNFTEFTGLGQVHPGMALSKNFNQINVNVDNISIEVESISNSLRISKGTISTGLLGGSGIQLTTNTDQSHVTKLGTISSGIWQGSNIGVPYGGTGRTVLPAGNILFGNYTNSIATDTNLFYDNTNIRLGLGTNAPSHDIEIKSSNSTTIFLNADSDANNPNSKPEILLSHSGNYNYYLAVTRHYNEYANNIYPNALVLSNQQTDVSSIIQLATNQQSRLTILSNGFIGINTTTPSTTLQVLGTLDVTDLTTFDSTVSSTSVTQAAVVITGGLSVGSIDNSASIFNGGSLTVAGGASIAKDLYIGGSINGAVGAANTFSYLTITASDGAINKSTGSLVTFGGITIQCTINSTSITNGGSLLVGGGASIIGGLYVGKTVNMLKDTYLGNTYFTSSSTSNYIQSPNSSRNTGSFLPFYFTQYNNTSANVLTVSDSTVVINTNHILQIGGNLQTPDGYNIYYTTSNLNLIPNNSSTISNYNINIGTIGSFSSLNIYGNLGGQLTWQSNQSNLLVNNSTIKLNKNDSTGSIVLTTPNINNTSFIKASGANMSINLGGNSTGGQLITILSNDRKDSTITFTPNNVTSSSLILTNNIYSTFNGPTNFTDRIEYAGNALHQSINNISNNSLWIYAGQINSLGPELGYCEIDFSNGITNTSGITGLKLTVSISGTTGTFAHSHYGNVSFNSIFKPICYIYNDTFNDYQLFVLLPPNSQTNINVTAQNASKFLLVNEGINSFPNGSISNFSSTWISVYKTNTESTLEYTSGDFTVEGLNFKTADNLPIIGYNNINTINERDIGTLYQRYQVPNDSGLGDIVSENDPSFYSDSIPNQYGIVVLNQLKLSSLANSIDNYYVGMWIKFISGSNINQVRKVISYNGAQNIITVSTPFTTQLPNTGSTVNFYNNGFVANFFDVRNDTFALGYTTGKPSNTYLGINNNANLRLKSLYSTDTTVSTNSSAGSVYLLGGISINNTNNAVSATYGGTITTRGGVGIQQNLLVGNDIGIGGSGFNPQESLHIRKNSSTIRLEHDIASYSYIDFMENSTSNRYGIIFDSSTEQLCLSNNINGGTPNISNKALTVNNLGYIGINTTSNITSPLVLNTQSFISTNSNAGYLGIIGAASNLNDSSKAARIQLFANSQTTNVSSGSLNLYGGNNSTGGNVSVFTNNDIERIRVDYNGSVSVLCTTYSNSKTSGALIINGGTSILTTQNSTSITSGGSLTTLGGVAIAKDVYIGGSLYITGSFTATGSVTNPNINSATIVYLNCSSFNYYHNNLQVNGSLGVLTLMFTVLPSSSSKNCEIQFTLPSRTNAFIRSFEVISSCTGYSDENNVVPLFNILSYGVIGTANINIKFQSISSNVHYFQLQATYILA